LKRQDDLHSEASYKRLEQGRFAWPPVRDGAIRLSTGQLGLLLEELDWSRVRPRAVIAPPSAG
jgi:transposase